MTFKEAIPLAKKLAENTLEKGFDVEAFLILSEIERMENEIEDKIPESNVDETISDIGSIFIDYYNDRKEETLKILLCNITKFLSELYYICSSETEVIYFKSFIKNIIEIIN